MYINSMCPSLSLKLSYLYAANAAAGSVANSVVVVGFFVSFLSIFRVLYGVNFIPRRILMLLFRLLLVVVVLSLLVCQ